MLVGGLESCRRASGVRLRLRSGLGSVGDFAFVAALGVLGDVAEESAAGLGTTVGDFASAASSGAVGDNGSAAAAAVGVAALAGLAGAGARLLFVC